MIEETASPRSGAPPVPLPRRSLGLLADLERRLRRAFLADGVAAIALIALAACLLSFALDYWLRLPRGVRFVLLGGAIAGAVVLAIRRVVRPLVRPLPAHDLAKLVERANPEFREVFLSAVELTRPGSEAASYVSPALLDDVIRRAEALAPSVSLRAVLDLRRLRRKVVIAGLLFAVVIGVAGARSDLAGTWFERNVLLSSVRWPKRTLVELIRPESNPSVVALGDNLDVEVKLLRGSPARVLVRSEERGGRVARVEPMAEVGGGVYRKIFPNVARPFRFFVEADDDRTDEIRVEVRLRPRIDMEKIRVWNDYPAYTGWEDSPPDEPQRFGNLKVPQGTRVRYAMETNIPVSAAYFVFEASDTQPEPTGEAWPPAGAQELEIAGGTGFGGEFEVNASGQYYFVFATLDGFRSQRPDRFRVESIPDRVPFVRVTRPERQTEEVSTDATVEIVASAQDDYGLAGGEIVGIYYPPRSDEGENRTFALDGLVTLAAGSESAESEGRFTLRVAELPAAGEGPPQPGARFQFLVAARDTAGNIGESRTHMVQILSRDDVLRILTDQLMVARDQLRDALRRQVSVRSDVEEFQKEALAAETINPANASRLARHRQDQQRVTASLEREVTELERIVGRMDSNRLGDHELRNWILAVRDDVEDVANRKSPAVEKELTSLQEAASAEPQKATRLAAVTSKQRQIERDLEALILRLTDFGDVSMVVDLLRQVRDRQEEIRDDTREALGAGSTEKQP